MPPPNNSSTLTLDPHMRRVALAIGYMVIAAGCAYALSVAWPVIHAIVAVLAPFALALVVAYLFNPVVNFVQRRLKLTRIWGVVAVNLMIVLIVGTFVAIVLPILFEQSKAAVDGIKSFTVDTAMPWLESKGVLTESPETLQAKFEAWLLANDLTYESLAKKVLGSAEVRSAASESAGFVGTAVARIVAEIASAIGALINSIVFLVFAGLVSFYLLLDFASLRGVVEILTPDRYEARLFDVLEKIDDAVGGFIRGQLIAAALVGVLAFFGLWVLGLKQYAVLIGCMAAVGNLIPYLGPTMGAAPAILYMLFSGVHDTTQERLIYSGLVIALFGLIQFIDGFIFQPRIVGRSASLHPVAVILALALGAQFGILGMVLAVPMACIVRVLLKEFWWDRAENEWRRTTGKKALDDPTPGIEARRGRSTSGSSVPVGESSTGSRPQTKKPEPDATVLDDKAKP